jgi:hypothetical protein
MISLGRSKKIPVLELSVVEVLKFLVLASHSIFLAFFGHYYTEKSLFWRHRQYRYNSEHARSMLGLVIDTNIFRATAVVLIDFLCVKIKA